MRPNDGGMAFHSGSRLEPADPALGHNQFVRVDYPGLSVRDYFAAIALNGCMNHGPNMGINTPQQQSAMAYRYADAMLNERAK